MSELLPPNATALERETARTLANIERVPVNLRDLWQPQRCPEALLPYLAWSFSVDRWDSAWEADTKRDVVRASFYVHQHKGTLSALRRVIEPLGYRLEVTEWWEQEPPGEPGTFEVAIGVRDTGITEALQQELERLIDDAKPLTRHVIGPKLFGEVRGAFFGATSCTDGETTAVYPYLPPMTESLGPLYIASGTDSFDFTTVYPR